MTGSEAEALSPETALEELESRARGLGVGEYEVYLVRKDSLTIGVKEGQVDQVRRNEELCAALRLIDRGRLGFAFTFLFTPQALDRTVSVAAAGTRVADPDPHLGLPGPPAEPWARVEGFDPELSRIPLERKIDRVREMEAAALDLDPRVEKVRQAEFREVSFALWLRNSRGLSYDHQGTVVTASVMVKAVEGAEAEMGYEADFARRYHDLDPGAVGREAAARAVAGLGGRREVTGRRPVILDRRVVAEFLEVLAASFLAENVQKGKSLLAGRLGRKVMAPGVSLVDHGLYPQGLATAPADAEGVPRQRTVLVREGVLEGFLYDFPRARADGVASTGNAARAGLKAPPAVSTSNLYLLPGDKDPADLYSALDQGFLVKEVMGVHTANPISGDFSLGASGLWLSAGQPARPVKGMALAGNILSMFSQVAEVGADLKFYGSTGAPSLLIEELTLSGL